MYLESLIISIFATGIIQIGWRVPRSLKSASDTIFPPVNIQHFNILVNERMACLRLPSERSLNWMQATNVRIKILTLPNATAARFETNRRLWAAPRQRARLGWTHSIILLDGI